MPGALTTCEMLFQILGPNGLFLRSQCKPSSFGSKVKLFLYFPLPRLLWNAAPKRCSSPSPSHQGAWEKGKQRKWNLHKKDRGQELCAVRFCSSWSACLSAPLPFPPGCWGNVSWKAETSESTASKVPELEGRQISSPYFSAIKQVCDNDSSWPCGQHVKEAPEGGGKACPLLSAPVLSGPVMLTPLTWLQDRVRDLK